MGKIIIIRQLLTIKLLLIQNYLIDTLQLFGTNSKKDTKLFRLTWLNIIWGFGWLILGLYNIYQINPELTGYLIMIIIGLLNLISTILNILLKKIK